MQVNLTKLNLPLFQPKLRKQKNSVQIYDFIRKKWIVINKEEWVRQSFLNYLTTHLNYPSGLIGVEVGVGYDTMTKRADIVVFCRNKNPLVVVECKAPDIRIDENVMMQALMYFKELQPKYVFLTNGINHVAVKISSQNQQIEYLNEIPDYLELEIN